MAEAPKGKPLSEATVDDLAEAVAAGVHVGLRRLMADLEAFAALKRTVEQTELD